MRLEDFFPVTFRMDMKDEREAFFNGMTRLNIWTDTGDKEILFQTVRGSSDKKKKKSVVFDSGLILTKV